MNRISSFNGVGNICWVCATPAEAKRRWHDMGEPQNVIMVTPGIAICGRQFDEIIVESVYRSDEHMHSETIRKHTEEWLDHLQCRLKPDGKWRLLTAPEEIFKDWGKHIDLSVYDPTL